MTTTLLLIFLLVLTIMASVFIAWPLWHTQKMWIAIPIMLLFFIAAVITYQHLGAWNALKTMERAKNIAAQEDREIQALGGEKAIIEKLKAHLKAHPSETQGWYLLGRIYLSEHHLTEAATCFTKAHELDPDRIDITIALAEVNYAQGYSQKAIALWQNVLTKIPANSDAAKALETAITQAQASANPS